MPAGWSYRLGDSGGAQRIAIVYDGSRVRLDEWVEFDVPERLVDGKDIFDRDPVAAYVTLLDGTTPRNDLVVVGLQLAGGQHLAANHDAAMKELLIRLESAQLGGQLGGIDEHDVLLCGTFNANAFQPPVEEFFVMMDREDGPWDLLVGAEAEVTRLSGTPLALRSSAIDYIIASRSGGNRRGLSGEEIRAAKATVHQQLIEAAAGADEFRRNLTDHLPVTVEVRITRDTDGP